MVIAVAEPYNCMMTPNAIHMYSRDCDPKNGYSQNLGRNFKSATERETQGNCSGRTHIITGVAESMHAKSGVPVYC